jgi:hypothetical protein
MESSYRRRISRHEQAVIQAEMRRLARALAPYRILHRDALEREVRAQQWHEGGFDQALHEAVRSGLVDPLPGRFYRGPHEPQTNGRVQDSRPA